VTTQVLEGSCLSVLEMDKEKAVPKVGWGWPRDGLVLCEARLGAWLLTG